MTKVIERLVIAYILLLLALAAWGAFNQKLYRVQEKLIEEKWALQNQYVNAHDRATLVTSPKVVRAWALEQGMIPAIEVKSSQNIMGAAPPDYQSPEAQNFLEFITIW